MPNKISLADRLPVPREMIERRIYSIRGHKIMIDSDLGDIYQVSTGNLNLAVRRNLERFPEDFMFQLTRKEYENLILQVAISSSRYGGRRFLPYAFTEHGVAMLSSVLNSKRAVQMNIVIVRAFVRLRAVLATHKELSRKVEKLEAGQRDHAIAIRLVAEDVQSLAKSVKRGFKELKAPRRQKARIGFYAGEKKRV